MQDFQLNTTGNLFFKKKSIFALKLLKVNEHFKVF